MLTVTLLQPLALSPSPLLLLLLSPSPLLQRLAKHVMQVHLHAVQQEEEEVEGELGLTTLKKFIAFCRT